jgi:hypothetical protein
MGDIMYSTYPVVLGITQRAAKGILLQVCIEKIGSYPAKTSYDKMC